MSRLLVPSLLLASYAFAGALKLETEPVVLGKTESVRLELTLDEPEGTEDRPLQLHTNVGSFGDVSRVGPGRFSVVYVPPQTRFPQVALIAAWRETGPDAAIEFFRVPLHGVTSVPVKVKPGSQVTVTLGKDETGPVTANAKGEATIALTVPPGVTTAELTVKEPSGLTTQKRLPIDVPPYNRLSAALVPHALRADGKAWARLEVFYDLGGSDVPPSRVKVVPSLGTASFMQANQGRYVYRVTPPETARDSVNVKVSIQQDATSTAQVTLSLKAPTATRLTVRPPARPLRADGESKGVLQVLAADDTGLGVGGVPVTLTLDGEALTVRELSGGLFEASFRAPSHYPPDGKMVVVAAMPGTNVRTTSTFSLAAPSVPSVVEITAPSGADASGPVELVLLAKDAAGQPLSGAALELHGPAGLGPVTETGPGRYQSQWTPASGLTGEVPITVRDQSGKFEKTSTVTLREPSGFELGVRGGFVHSLGDQFSPRGSLELWRDFRVGPVRLGLGLTAGYSYASQTVTVGSETSQSTAHVLPVTLRLGIGLVDAGRFSLTVGGAAVGACAFFSTSLTGEQASGFGAGGQGFLAAALAVGPGKLFLEAGYGFAPVRTAAFSVQASGLFVELGYRFVLK